MDIVSTETPDGVVQAEMEEKEESRTLPEELVERIIATMPFPHIFKARCLSKLWLTRLSPIASLDDDRLAGAFQRQMLERSQHWGTFYPVCIESTHCMAFNRASRSWQTMPSLRYLPWSRVNSSQVRIIGALLFAPTGIIVDRHITIQGPGATNPPQRKDLFVANIVTGSWRQLPPRPQIPRRGNRGLFRKDYGQTLVSGTTPETYRVIAFCLEYDRYYVQIYHSEAAAWSTRRLAGVFEFFDNLRTPAYLNGILYMMAGYRDHSAVAFDIEAGTYERFALSSSDASNEPTIMQSLAICNSELLVIRSFDSPTRKGFNVLKVDLESLQLSREAGHPLPPEPWQVRTLSLGKCSTGPRAEFGQEPVSDGSRIFLGLDKYDGSMVEYNVHENKWSCTKFPATNPSLATKPSRRYDWAFGDGDSKPSDPSDRYDWVGSCLQPGLNPFIAV